MKCGCYLTWGRCADHVSRDTLRLLKQGYIEEVPAAEFQNPDEGVKGA